MSHVERMRALRPKVRQRDRGRCVPRVSPHCNGRAEQTHHILPTTKGGPDAMHNLVSVCWGCHQWIETGHPDRARRLGWLRQRSDGPPPDPEWWMNHSTPPGPGRMAWP